MKWIKKVDIHVLVKASGSPGGRERLGLMVGIGVVVDPHEVVDAARAHNLLVLTAGDDTVPFCFTRHHHGRHRRGRRGAQTGAGRRRESARIIGHTEAIIRQGTASTLIVRGEFPAFFTLDRSPAVAR
jgi:hypothetical protein